MKINQTETRNKDILFKNKIFFIVLARDKRYVKEKILELENIKVPYIIVCGEKINHPNIIYRPPKGKYDAINYAINFIPNDVDIIVFNDIDTCLYNFNETLKYFEDPKIALVYVPEQIINGPQVTFYKIFNSMREKIPLAGSGELMLIRKKVLDKMTPIKPCKGEDTYILFKVLELGYNVAYCKECIVTTVRTKNVKSEEMYRRKTVTGVYQALSYTNPPILIKLFYIILPLASILLLFLGNKGYYWFKGIIKGFVDYIMGDRSGYWNTDYLG
ncbi:MAG: hypothetical protein QW738_02245 [Nitrososphaeria archaeon]